MTKPTHMLTRQELAIMKSVWRRGTASVRDVHDDIASTRPVAYTTILTMLNLLERKGFVAKEPSGRAFVYRPLKREQTVVTAMVRDFVHRVFDGASHPLVMHLVKGAKLTPAERRELAALVKATQDK